MSPSPVIRRAQAADTRRVAREVIRGSRGVPGIAPKLLGRLLPAWLLARIYRYMLSSGRGQIWIAETPTAFAAVVALERGNALEAVDFVSTGEMLGLTLAVATLKLVDENNLTVVIDTHGRLRQSYFRRIGFEPAAGDRMIRRARAEG